MPQENFNYVDQGTFAIAGGSPLAGQSVNSSTTYVVTWAPIPGRFTASGKQLYGCAFIRLSDILTSQQNALYIDPATLAISGGPPLAGQSVNPSTTYVVTWAPIPSRFTASGKQLYGREFVRLSEISPPQENASYVDQGTLAIAGGSPLAGQSVNSSTTYVVTWAPIPGRFTASGKQLYAVEMVRLSDVLNATSAAA